MSDDPHTVLVTGDRKWSSWEVVAEALAGLPEGSTVIHGAARGADTIAGKVADQLGHKVIAVPAQWNKNGRAAGPIRNREMLDMNPDFVIAFHNDLDNSKGTRDCVQEALKRGLDVIHWNSDGDYEVYGS